MIYVLYIIAALVMGYCLGWYDHRRKVVNKVNSSTYSRKFKQDIMGIIGRD